MATTDWAQVEELQAHTPHTFNALQHLVMAMAKVVKYKGKKSLFGRDKGLIAYKDFEQKLRDTILAMVLDGFFGQNPKPAAVRETICSAIGCFAEAFPNWQDAYRFAEDYFIDNSKAAEERIRVLTIPAV